MRGSLWLVAAIGGALNFGLLLGLFLVWLPEYRRAWARFRLRHRLPAGPRPNPVEGPWLRGIRLTLATAIGRPVPPRLAAVGLGLLFGVLLWVGSRSLNPAQAVLTAAIGSVLPCLLIYLRASGIRLRGSYEGETLVSEFLRQYRLCAGNVDNALEQVVRGKAAIRRTRKMVYRLLIELRAAGNPEQIRRATDDFAGSLSTNWGRMLAGNICLAATGGSPIGPAVEDILIQLREARTLAEERKRLNSESIRMTWFLVPAIYVATVWMATRYLGLSPLRFLHNQFYTAEGFLFFSLIIFLFLADVCLLSFVIHQRFDF